MAKRYSSNKGRKIEPAVQTFYLKTPSVDGLSTTSLYCDLSQIASLMNRRFYRQGINWAVAGIKLLSPAGITGAIVVAKLPNTWVMSNAWTKSFKAWQRMNNQALAENASLKPKFLDFKIYADAGHHAVGFGANLLPSNATTPPVNYVAGEWEPSKYEIPTGTAGTPGNTVKREILATGANFPGLGASGFDAVSVIEGYAASRGLPNVIDPNTPGDADDADGFNPDNWITAIFNDGTNQDEGVIEMMITDNNIAPYPFENDGTHFDTMYPGGANQAPGMQIHDVEYITGTTIGGTTRLKGGNFPCGLIRFDISNTSETSSTYALQIELIPGNHRGYLCEPMMEM